MQTDILLIRISQDQPEFESRSYVYFFGGAYELKSIFPLVAKNARRKAVQLFHDYIGGHRTCALASLTDGLETSPVGIRRLARLSVNLRESF